MDISPAILERLALLEQKFDAMGQDMVSYLDGLLYADYLTYWDYIQLDTLTSLQNPRTPFPDESVFIMYHQVTELYFKMALHELQQVVEKPGDAAFLLERMRRVTRYFKILTESFSVMVDGMELDQFLKFRMALLPASGFQSAQYREIEIYATELEQLTHPEFRSQLTGQETPKTLFQHIYWKSGATELATGKKTLTLRQFEAKYGENLFHRATALRGKTIYAMFKALSPEEQAHPELREVLRIFDYQVNVDWPMAHMKSAARYLKKDPVDIQATGGTNWQKYLPPRFQLRIFFPELWSKEELEQWGRQSKYASPQ